MTEEDRDWTYRLARVLGALGFNEMRIRWKLMRWQENWRRGGEQAQNRSRWVRYEHKVCVSCRALNDREEERCVRCGAALPGRAGQVVGRLGVLFGISPTVILIGLMVAIFAWMKVEQGGGLMADFTLQTLVSFGGNSPFYTIAENQWWRLSTCVLLHGSLMHLGFNMWAFYMVGPALEGIYGRIRVVTFFMITGVLASLASVMLLDYPVGIGASGAIMGLFGVICGWGHRQGTAHGRGIRNRMFRLVAIVTVFGFAMGGAGISVDHVAHIAGFVAGGVLGWLPLERTRSALLMRGLFGADLVSGLLLLATAVTCFVAPGTPAASRNSQSLRNAMIDPTPSEVVEAHLRFYPACQAYREGRPRQLQELIGTEQNQILNAVCTENERMTTRCALFRSGGLDAVIGTSSEGRERGESTAFYRDLCARLPEPPPSINRINPEDPSDEARRRR